MAMTPPKTREEVVRELHDERYSECNTNGRPCPEMEWLQRAVDAGIAIGLANAASVMDDHYKAGRAEGEAAGRAAERADVVAWFQEQIRLVEADPTNDVAKKNALMYWRQIGEAVGRAAHVGGKEGADG